MSIARHRRAQELFEAASSLSSAERASFLERECGADSELRERIGSLLESDEGPGAALDTPAMEQVLHGAPAVLSAGPEAALPERIGRYRVLARLGSGGMGVVYEAEQDQPRRTVALKVLRRGFVTEGLLRRFEHEAEILGWLNHPGIAQIYEAGTADVGDGRQPFFALELVRGEPLTTYARTRKLSTRARLELLARVCDAVHHAHMKGVVHRDLKPSNILVDATGCPKVLDFGVARVTGSDLQATTMLTDVGQLVGTLAYMSPEQIEADPSRIDARADVYALGVIAYELLAGRRPYEVDAQRIHAAARVIVEQEPSSLGSVDRQLRGDIETIVGKAIEKERERRYASADELASDIRRHLAHEPIVARPASATYQVRKFARRNTVLVAGVAGIFLALVAGSVVSLRLYLRAEDARAAERLLRVKAEDASAVLRATNQYFLSLLASPHPWIDGADVKMGDVLDRAAGKIQHAFPDRPTQRAALLETLGSTYAGLGLWQKARGFLAEALELQRTHAGDQKETIAFLEESLARTLKELNELDAAESMILRAIADYEALEPPASATAKAACRQTLANILLSQDRLEQAQAHARAAVALLESVEGITAAALSSPRQTLAHILVARGEFAEAEAVCRLSLDAQLDESDEDTAGMLLTMNTLGLILHNQHRDEEAVPWMERALAGTRRLTGEDHPFIATQTNNLGTVMRGIGRLDDAERLYRESVRLARKLWPGPHEDVAINLGNLGSLLQARGELEEAESILREADAMLIELFGRRTLRRGYALWYLGETLRDKGELDASAEALEEALDIRNELLSESHPDLAVAHRSFGGVQLLRGNTESAVEHFRAARAIYSASIGPSAPNTMGTTSDLALALLELGEIENALELSEAAWRVVEQDYADRPRMVSLHRANHGWCLFRAGRTAEAEPLLREGLDALVASYGPEHSLTRRQRERIVELDSALAR